MTYELMEFGLRCFKMLLPIG